MNSVKQKLLATAAVLPLAFGLTSAATMFESGVAGPIGTVKAACNPCGVKKGGCNPCAPADWAVGNPCAAAKASCNPCAVQNAACSPCRAESAACNPCAVAGSPCNPCAVTSVANNPCSVENPCALVIPDVESTMSVDEIMAALKAPPKLPLGKVYSLDEIEKDFEVRSLLQAVEVKSVGFEFDSANVKGMQAGYLGNVAAAIHKILEVRPHEVFFVEGHADAPGSYNYNLKLSKRRALHVKNALVNVFGIPEGNIMAAGFGEMHPKIATERREQANRRVTVRCITPLLKMSTPKQ